MKTLRLIIVNGPALTLALLTLWIVLCTSGCKSAGLSWTKGQLREATAKMTAAHGYEGPDRPLETVAVVASGTPRGTMIASIEGPNGLVAENYRVETTKDRGDAPMPFKIQYPVHLPPGEYTFNCFLYDWGGDAYNGAWIYRSPKGATLAITTNLQAGRVYFLGWNRTESKFTLSSLRACQGISFTSDK